MKFIMTNRRAGRAGTAARLESRNAVDRSFESFRSSVDVLGDRTPGEESRRTVVFEGDPAEMAQLKASMPEDVMIEPAIMYRTLADQPAASTTFDLLKAPPADLRPLFLRDRSAADMAGGGTVTEVIARSAGSDKTPLVGAEVHLFLSGPFDMSDNMVARTNAQGSVAFDHAPFYKPLGAIVVPHGGYWPRIVRGGSGTIRVDCPPLPAGAPFGWWHRAMGIRPGSDGVGLREDGTPVRVGVIDSGCGPHAGLAHVHVAGSIIDGEFDPDGGADSGSHGSHVCGIIGGRGEGDGFWEGVTSSDPAFVEALPESDGYWGAAPGVDLVSIRVFPEGDGGANQGDIADALDMMADDHAVDLVNMSLGSPQPSEIMRDAIISAFEAGTLCICAAGNSAGPVSYPAKFPETVAVAAIGRLGWVPDVSLPALPTDPDLFGNEQLYAAEFTCFGDEIGCCAPGVGYVSTVPERFGLEDPYASMNGTSMASPAACGALAVLVGRDPAYQTMPANAARAKYARALLYSRCRNIGLPTAYQGHGLVTVRS